MPFLTADINWGAGGIRGQEIQRAEQRINYLTECRAQYFLFSSHASTDSNNNFWTKIINFKP